MRQINSNIKVKNLEKKLGVPTGTIRNPNTRNKIKETTSLKTLRERNKKSK